MSAAGVRCRGYSLGLERILTDFGAEESFERASQRVAGHYRIEVSASGIRRTTHKHGEAMQFELETPARMPEQGVRQMLTEMDGSMIPVVEFEAGETDRRKQKRCVWREAKLCLAGQVGSTVRRYRASLGSVGQAGLQWRRTVIESGGGKNTHLHCVGDGARWLVNQVKKQFGGETAYLVDFYHVSDYLSQASKTIGGKQSRKWLEKAQAKMKINQVDWVLGELAEHLEEESVGDQEAPVRVCCRYLQNRLEYLDYAGAIEQGLPIGSGEVESGHRTVIQKRLKLAGAWWREENAEKMLAIRAMRANREWGGYWKMQRLAHS